MEEDSTAQSGLYKIAPTDNKGEFTVYCDMSEGWTVIQRRQDNTTDFYRDWQQYKTGFGEMDGNFWLGLEKIHRITQIESHELMITMVDHDDVSYVARYDLFKVDSEATDYQLEIGKYMGASSSAGNSLQLHDNEKFSTYDNDNDDSRKKNCAKKHHGAWWYKSCHESNLNGKYYYEGDYSASDADGIVWHGVGGYWHSLKTVVMAIRPV